MLYRAPQITLWPRLLTAAQIDPVLLEALQQLLRSGANLGLNEAGRLQLYPGDMTREAYDAVARERLTPRREKMKTILSRARDSSHPWLQSIMQAYTDLRERTVKGHAALHKQIAAQQTDKARDTLTALVERTLQAMALAQALWNGGYPAYAKSVSEHTDQYISLRELMGKIGLRHPPDDWQWPVETPDGRLWLVNRTQGPGDGELRIHDGQLGEALLSVAEAAGLLREVG